jgi:hypothetical protein
MKRDDIIRMARESGLIIDANQSGFDSVETFAALVAAAAIAAIKEALAQPAQEPVCWVMPDGKTVDKWGRQFYGSTVGEPLYTTPQQRPWVGLTDEEIDAIDEANWEEDHKAWGIREFARAIEAKFKEKNT